MDSQKKEHKKPVACVAPIKREAPQNVTPMSLPPTGRTLNWQNVSADYRQSMREQIETDQLMTDFL